MPRKPPRPGPSPDAAGARRIRSFDELGKLRRNDPDRTTAPPTRAQAEPASPRPPAGAGRQDERTSADDIQHFRKAVSDVTPLADTHHVHLEPPKPAPIPRHPRETAPEAQQEPAARAEPTTDAAWFREAMHDVVPLPDSGRAEIGRVAPSRAKRPDDPVNAESGGKPSRARTFANDLEGLDETELFRLAMLGIEPIPSQSRVELQRPTPEPQPIKRTEDEQAALREAMETPMTLEDRLDAGDEVAFLRPGVPRRVLADLRRGRWVLQGELDLHGLKRDEAREALSAFIADCVQQGRRCVRIIHGKGLGSPGKQPVLKQLSHGWLAQREDILAFCQAGPAQGGSGAIMALLRGRKAARD